METGHGSDEAETESVSGGATAALQSVKALEDVLKFVGRNSSPVIGDRNHSMAIALTDFYSHPTGFPAMLDSVVDEIGHRIEQEISITGDEDSLLPNRTEMSTSVLGRGIEELHDLPCDLGQIYGAERGCSITRLNL